MLVVLSGECPPSTHACNLLALAISHFSYTPLHSIYLE